MKKTFEVPPRDKVSLVHQASYDNLVKALGFVPNLYAQFAHSDNALSIYLAAQNAKSSLTNREKEAVNLIVSQVNDCAYCIAAHTIGARKNGFLDYQILELRNGVASFDDRIDALVRLAKDIAGNKGKVDPEIVNNFLVAGYTRGNLIDVIMLVGIRSIANYVFALTAPPIDFPVAPQLVTRSN